MMFNYQTGLGGGKAAITATLAAGVFTVAGQPVVTADTAFLGPGVFALTGQSLLVHAAAQLQAGVFTLVGESLNAGAYRALAAGVFTLTGEALVARPVTNLGDGSFVLVGESLNYRAPQLLDPGLFFVTGNGLAAAASPAAVQFCQSRSGTSEVSSLQFNFGLPLTNPSTILVFVMAMDDYALHPYPNAGVDSVTIFALDSNGRQLWSQSLGLDCFEVWPNSAYGPNCWIWRCENTHTDNNVKVKVVFSKPQYCAFYATEWLRIQPNSFGGHSSGTAGGNNVMLTAGSISGGAQNSVFFGGFTAAFTQFTGGGFPTPPPGFSVFTFLNQNNVLEDSYYNVHGTYGGEEFEVVWAAPVNPPTEAVTWPQSWNIRFGSTGIVARYQGVPR